MVRKQLVEINVVSPYTTGMKKKFIEVIENGRGTFIQGVYDTNTEVQFRLLEHCKYEFDCSPLLSPVVKDNTETYQIENGLAVYVVHTQEMLPAEDEYEPGDVVYDSDYTRYTVTGVDDDGTVVAQSVNGNVDRVLTRSEIIKCDYVPKVGRGFTISSWYISTPGTIVSVSKTGKKITVEHVALVKDQNNVDVFFFIPGRSEKTSLTFDEASGAFRNKSRYIAGRVGSRFDKVDIFN